MRLVFYLCTLCGSCVELTHVLHCRQLLKQRAMTKMQINFKISIIEDHTESFCPPGIALVTHFMLRRL